MKKFFSLLYIIIAAFSAKADYWTQKANYPQLSLGIKSPFSFSIGSKGYVGCGYNGSNYKQDFWEYDPSVNAWTQKADFAGVARYQATGFCIGNKGYAGFGTASASGLTTFNDFWEYDQTLNTWTQMAPLPSSSRTNAVGFSIGIFGYLATGMFGPGIFLKDLWQYDPQTDVWISKTNLTGAARYASNCFVLDNNAYIVCGFTSGGGLSDVWEYNSTLDTWSQKANFPDTSRGYAASFSICDKGYFGTGIGNLNACFADLWQYDPFSNQWLQKTSFGGTARYASAFFSIGTKGFIGMGGLLNNTFYNDFWEYTPDSACATGIEELPTSDLQFTISPNPAKEFIVITIPGFKNPGYLMITDVNGKKVYQTNIQLLTSDLRLPTSGFSEGIYFVEITNGKQKAVKKLIIADE